MKKFISGILCFVAICCLLCSVEHVYISFAVMILCTEKLIFKE